MLFDDQTRFYRTQTELAESQIKFLENQDKILREQVKISKEQKEFTKILMFATIILALAGSAQVIYYFELFSQSMVKDFYDFLALVLLAIILASVSIIFLKLMFDLILRNLFKK